MARKVKGKVAFSVYLTFETRERLERIQEIFIKCGIDLSLSAVLQECINVLYGLIFLVSGGRDLLLRISHFPKCSFFPDILKFIQSNKFSSDGILSSKICRFKASNVISPHHYLIHGEDGKFCESSYRFSYAERKSESNDLTSHDDEGQNK